MGGRGDGGGVEGWVAQSFTKTLGVGGGGGRTMLFGRNRKEVHHLGVCIYCIFENLLGWSYIKTNYSPLHPPPPPCALTVNINV
jgi:hypothetical protein